MCMIEQNELTGADSPISSSPPLADIRRRTAVRMVEPVHVLDGLIALSLSPVDFSGETRSRYISFQSTCCCRASKDYPTLLLKSLPLSQAASESSAMARHRMPALPLSSTAASRRDCTLPNMYRLLSLRLVACTSWKTSSL